MYYNATKGAVDLLTRGLAAEYSKHGIRVNGISPSLGNTALVSQFVGEEFDSEMAKAHATQAPVQRMVTPLDIAKGCLYLVSPYFNDYQTYVPKNSSNGFFLTGNLGVLCSELMVDNMYVLSIKVYFPMDLTDDFCSAKGHGDGFDASCTAAESKQGFVPRDDRSLCIGLMFTCSCSQIALFHVFYICHPAVLD